MQSHRCRQTRAARAARNRCLQASFTLEASENAELRVTWREKDDGEAVRERMLQCFLRQELDNQYKEAQWENAKNIVDRAAWLEWIEALALDDVEKGLLKEQLELLGER